MKRILMSLITAGFCLATQAQTSIWLENYDELGYIQEWTSTGQIKATVSGEGVLTLGSPDLKPVSIGGRILSDRFREGDLLPVQSRLPEILCRRDPGRREMASVHRAATRCGRGSVSEILLPRSLPRHRRRRRAQERPPDLPARQGGQGYPLPADSRRGAV